MLHILGRNNQVEPILLQVYNWFEFSFSWIVCHTKIKELSLPYYLSIAEGRIDSYICQGYKHYVNSLIQYLNSCN